MNGCVFDIQRFSVHDGPGIRTTVFLKGCNLRCFWCHNPESIGLRPEIEEVAGKCIGCGKCYEVCPTNAITIKDGIRMFRRELCSGCGKCTETCFSGARVLIGKTMSVDEVIESVERDRPFYDRSGGGVTFSGGEPLLQKDFLKMLLEECKNKGFHTAVDTAGNVPWENFEAVMPYTDLFLYDLKVMDESRHREATGASNILILENIRKLSDCDRDIIIRIPVIPGVNDTEENMRQVSSFLCGLKKIKLVEMLPFHQLASGKYENIGKEYGAKDLRPLDRKDVIRLSEILLQKGIPVKVS